MVADRLADDLGGAFPAVLHHRGDLVRASWLAPRQRWAWSALAIALYTALALLGIGLNRMGRLETASTRIRDDAARL